MRNLADALNNLFKEPNLPPAEWDFRLLIHKLPTDKQRHELRAAIYYEYARESPAIRSLSKKYGNLPDQLRRDFQSLRWSGDPAISEPLFFLSSLPFANCILWSEYFPKMPWLLIPQPARDERIAHYLESSSRALFELKALDQVRPWEVSDPATRRFTSSIEHLLIAIDWTGGSNNDIAEALANWIRKNRPSRFPPPHDDASRENVNGAFLTRLAVMRLLHTHAHLDAVDQADRHGLPMPKQQSKALSARKRVLADIRRVFQSEGFKQVTGKPLIPAKEFPLSWRTLAREKRTRV
jgi:hypothetical protein